MIPKYLYHYTSLETLQLIIENNKFRFNRLDQMNDPYEGHNSIFANSRKNVFSSSWTAEFRDELPMWKMYTDLKGVRLRMPIDLFHHEDKLEVVKMGRMDDFMIKSNLNHSYKIEVDLSNLPKIKEDNQTFEVKSVYGPSKVDYYETQESLEKDVVVKNHKANFDLREINTTILGQRKFDYWSFEKEYRYRIFSAQMMAGSLDVLTAFEQFAIIKTEYIDVEFRQECLENGEITLGPKSDPGNIALIKDILSKKGINNANVQISKIRIQ
jgi:hypothetical protein